MRTLSLNTARIFAWGLFIMSFSVPATAGADTLKVGTLFPDLHGYGLRGAIPAVTGKVVIVDFWASWCGPCKASFPVLSELKKTYEGRGLVIVGVSVDEKEVAYETFLKRMSPGFVTLHDMTQKLVNALQVPVMPTSYIVDKQGVLRYVHEGFHGDRSKEEFVQEIEKLLNEPAGT